MPLIDSLTDYRNAINDANSYITFAHQRDRARRYKLTVAQRDFITTAAFLKMFIAWESLLESSFIKYMMGEPSVLGHVIVRYSNPLNVEHANRMLVGTQRYVDWANHESVDKLSNLYFAPGNPFSATLRGITASLADLKTLRNATAHLSTTTRRPLEALAQRLIGRPVSNVPTLLLTINPSSATGDNILQTYLEVLDVAAEQITNG